MHISKNVSGLQPSATIAVASLARELHARGRDIIDLSAGEPDFDTPAFIAEAGVAAIQSGHTRYTAAAGALELRRAIARHLSAAYSADVDAAQIVVSAGAKQALFNAIFSLAGPGDAVLLPAPYWTSYPALIGLARAETVEVRGVEEDGFRVGPDALEAAYRPHVRGLLLNSPANPTGAVYGLDELRDIARWAADRGVWIISDEIYSRICYTTERSPGLLDLAPEERGDAVIVNGASKCFAMTGWRIGFAVAPPEIAARMAALQSHTTSNAATPSQHAALAAYSDTDRREPAVTAMAARFAERRDLVLRLIAEHLPGAGFVKPDGAFYLFLRVDAWYPEAGAGSVAFCQRILEEAGVALVPGAAFGDDRFVRLSFATSVDALEQGIARLGRAVPAALSPRA